MRLVLYILILSSFCCLKLFAQKQMRGVWGSGGSTAKSGQTIIHGTVSQTAIGRSKLNINEVKSGFWYTTRSRLPKSSPGLIVVIPTFSGKAGETIEMPIILESSVALQYGRDWKFKGTFHFNATVLEPISGFDSYARANDIGTLDFSGNSRDTAGIIKKITFKVKLGNQPISPVAWDTFSIAQYQTATIIRKDGEFQLEDLCFTDGKPRLIGTVKQGLALSAFPLPAKGTLTIATSTVEKGISEIFIYSPDGKLVTTIFHGELNQGYSELPIDTEYIPSGTYFIVLKTPSDMLTTSCIIAK
ncbi:MAG: T9SS type A sorting domain-containing protein [Candidatus Kapaibacteriota bacterium]